MCGFSYGASGFSDLTSSFSTEGVSGVGLCSLVEVSVLALAVDFLLRRLELWDGLLVTFSRAISSENVV